MDYPTRNGLPISPFELDLPASRERRRNNHHSAWTASVMSRLAVTQTFRDLEAYQDIMPLDQHNWIHHEYEPPRIDLQAVFDRVMQAYDLSERLRLGSAFKPVYKPISDEKLAKIKREYDRYGR